MTTQPVPASAGWMAVKAIANGKNLNKALDMENVVNRV